MGSIVSAIKWPYPEQPDPIPVHIPNNVGDIVMSELHWGHFAGQNQWDHASLYVGNVIGGIPAGFMGTQGDENLTQFFDCIEADPHMEPSAPPNSDRVEYTSIFILCHEYRYGQAQAFVYTSQTNRNLAADFAKEKEAQGRRYDFDSWGLNIKWEDGPAWSHKGKYFCSELVWASYWAGAGINIDPSDPIYDVDHYNTIYQNELIENNDRTYVYWQYWDRDPWS